MEYDERHMNYIILCNSYRQLQSGKPVTNHQEHVDFFDKIRKFFDDFTIVMHTIEDEEYRKKCVELETLAVYSERYISQTGRLDYSVYKLFLERLIYIYQYSEENDELSNQLENLGI